MTTPAAVGLSGKGGGIGDGDMARLFHRLTSYEPDRKWPLPRELPASGGSAGSAGARFPL